MSVHAIDIVPETQIYVNEERLGLEMCEPKRKKKKGKRLSK